MHLGHSIASGDRADIMKSAKKSCWISFNIFCADFGHISSRIKKMYYFKYIVVFLWRIKKRVIAILYTQITENATSLELVKSYRNLTICDWSINWSVLYDVISL